MMKFSTHPSYRNYLFKYQNGVYYCFSKDFYIGRSIPKRDRLNWREVNNQGLHNSCTVIHPSDAPRWLKDRGYPSHCIFALVEEIIADKAKDLT